VYSEEKRDEHIEFREFVKFVGFVDMCAETAQGLKND
jgi:hypothetical protein